MSLRLDLLIIAKNSEKMLISCLSSVKGMFKEIILIDNFSTDSTAEIAKKFGSKVYKHHEYSLGRQKAYGLSKCTSEWVLNLDSDEVLSEELQEEIRKLDIGKLRVENVTGFIIPYQNHLFGKPINYGGENYKMLRLFRRDAVKIDDLLVHEHFELKFGKTKELKGKILHYSYRSIPQMYKKFTDYAIREAKQRKSKGERSSFKKIFFYPAHMFWARFIKDKGHKDGLFRIPLDLGFAYMEWLTYVTLTYYSLKQGSKVTR